MTYKAMNAFDVGNVLTLMLSYKHIPSFQDSMKQIPHNFKSFDYRNSIDKML